MIHESYQRLRSVVCPCEQQFSTTSRNQRFCQSCILKKNLGEPYGAELAAEKAA